MHGQVAQTPRPHEKYFITSCQGEKLGPSLKMGLCNILSSGGSGPWHCHHHIQESPLRKMLKVSCLIGRTLGSTSGCSFCLKKTWAKVQTSSGSWVVAKYYACYSETWQERYQNIGSKDIYGRGIQLSSQNWSIV